MIGNIVKVAGVKQPKYSQFAKLKKEDKIVYYATKDYVVVGLFEVVSDMEYLHSDPNWKEIMVYRIKPTETPPIGNYFDFKKLVKDQNVTLEMIPNKKTWGIYLQGKTCISISEEDYLKIKDSLSKPKYLKNVQKIKIAPTKWHREHGKKGSKVKENLGRHQRAIEKWKTEEELKFGGFIRPQIKMNTVDLNEILPKSIWLQDNKKYIDALARLDIGGQPFYQCS